MGGEKTSVLKGCIKAGKGPWLVHRTTRDGSVVTRFRYPSDRERQNNKKRERERRSVTRNIFAGLRAHGNYQLRRHADSNDLLIALCKEAGWDVDEDGNISRKNSKSQMIKQVPKDCRYQDEDYCKCNDSKINVGEVQSRTISPMVIISHDEYEINLALSLSPSHTFTESN